MREINLHLVHCADTPDDKDFDVKDIDRWHRERGWSGCGYHFVIKRDGTIQIGRSLDKMGAHCRGYNKNSVGTCLIGRENFTVAQYTSLRKLDDFLRCMYGNIETKGHYEFSNKTCPNFNVAKVIGV